ncbi:hypothetical protein ACSLNT_22325, partial [Escherichia coli]
GKPLRQSLKKLWYPRSGLCGKPDTDRFVLFVPINTRFEIFQHTLRLPPQEGRLRSRFYQLQAIEKEWMEEDGSVSLQVRMPIVDWRRLCKQEPALIDYLI